MMNKSITVVLLSAFCYLPGYGQIDEEKTGAWYMYFINAKFNENSLLGIQADLQFRNWNLGGDLEQLLIRTGVTYTPANTDLKTTVGYAHVINGEYGNNKSTNSENRIFQEVLLPVKIGARFHTAQRFRYEQRFISDQNIRTRYRYQFTLNVPLNDTELSANTLYFSIYNEIFINGQRNIGNNQYVNFFDRNRFYFALGHCIRDNFKIQLGLMNQLTNDWKKNQIQLSIHNNF